VTAAVVDLAERRPRLGGSTIGAAAGIDPYCSPIRLWLELTGRITRAETEAMRLGRRLEPAIFEELTERGYPCTRTPDAELRDPAAPWLIGHPDGYGVGPLDGAVIDAKASGRAWETLPVQYAAQAQTYMRLAGLGEAVVAQLGGLTFTVWEVEYHPHLADVLLQLGETFMDYVRRDVQPPPAGHDDDRAALLLAHPDVTPGRKVRETREVADARRELALLTERAHAWKARVEYLRAVLTGYMGDADTLVSAHDETVATWKATSRRSLDTARLRAERPDVYEAYSTLTTGRRFLLA
jgi:predicted phage-related endonuclease